MWGTYEYILAEIKFEKKEVTKKAKMQKDRKNATWTDGWERRACGGKRRYQLRPGGEAGMGEATRRCNL